MKNMRIKRSKIIALCLAISFFVLIPAVKAEVAADPYETNSTYLKHLGIKTFYIKDRALYERLKGRFLIKVEGKGESYYVDPTLPRLIYLSDYQKNLTTQMAGPYSILMDPDLFKKIPHDIDLVNKHKGHIIKSCEPDEATGKCLGPLDYWYLNPTDGKKYFIGTPKDLMAIVKKFGTGISNRDFNRLALNRSDSEIYQDEMRIKDIETIRLILKLYYSDHGYYPASPTSGTKLGKPGAKTFSSKNGFNDKTGGTIYTDEVPGKENLSGRDYVYKAISKDNTKCIKTPCKSYILEFVIVGPVNEITCAKYPCKQTAPPDERFSPWP